MEQNKDKTGYGIKESKESLTGIDDWTEIDGSVLEKLATRACKGVDNTRVENAIITRNGKTAYLTPTHGMFTCYGCGIFANNLLLTKREASGSQPEGKRKLSMLEGLLSGAENLVLTHATEGNDCGTHETAKKIADLYGIKNAYSSFAHFRTGNRPEYIKQIVSFSLGNPLDE